MTYCQWRERYRERERESLHFSLFSCGCLWLDMPQIQTNMGFLLLHESQLGQTVQTSNFWWTKNGEWLTSKTVLIHIYAVSEPQTKKQLRNHGRLLKSHMNLTLEDSEVLHAHFGNVKERSTPQVRQRGYLLSLAALGAVLLFNASSSCWGWLELRILRFN